MELTPEVELAGVVVAGRRVCPFGGALRAPTGAGELVVAAVPPSPQGTLNQVSQSPQLEVSDPTISTSLMVNVSVDTEPVGARLGRFWQVWEEVGASPWVVKTP